MKYTETATSSGTAASMISGPVVSTPDQSTGSNTLILVGSIGAVFILLVVTILVILIVSVLVCRRRGSSNPLNTHTDVHHQTIVNVADIDSKCIVSNISSNPAYGIIGGKNKCINVAINPAYGMRSERRHDNSTVGSEYDEPKTVTGSDESHDDMILNESYNQMKVEEVYDNVDSKTHF
ncbi:PREDICTED: uncharacterized protein LOC109591757 isoform X2 [Amphimedon queenslandica]|uniref:Uncharacterized protein n=1 Tax=Amphimedon queenslandica TaxID=400682 RepID=A0A1X7SRZ9_AMPQE|nr:PREDICTED: uncharacterized protein LOC109591757 isoform X2 [Amphimedon queenslandica]|eukprot:XP_019862973.1 PREDICTED: uncharacterized protein LOC109591757 isoform X2 [Amphimedon queenslandica]